MKKLLIIFLIAIFSISMIFIGIGCKEAEAIEEEVAEEETVKEEETVEEEKVEEEQIEETEEVTGNPDWLDVTNALINPREFEGTTLNCITLTGGVADNWIANSNEFTEATGIILNYSQYNYGDLLQKTILDTTSGDPNFDIYTNTYGWYPDIAGGLADLEEMVKKYPDAPSLELGDFSESALNIYGKHDGKLLSIPWMVGVTFLFWNKAYLKEAGLDSENGPSTWQEVYDFGLEINDPPNRYGFGNIAGKSVQTTVLWMLILNEMGGIILDDDLVPHLDSEICKEATKFMVEKLGGISPRDSNVWDYPELQTAFMTGTTGISFMWPAALAEVTNPEVSTVADNVGYDKSPSGSVLGGWEMGMSNASKNEAAAFLYLSWLTSRDFLHKSAMGGQIVARTPILNDSEVLEAFPYFKTVADALNVGIPLYQKVLGNEIINIIANNINLAVSGDITSEQASANMQQEVLDLMEERGL